MDGSHFDAWTRRRFGVIAGGLAVSLLGVASSDEAIARRKRRKKKGRCRDVTESCGGKKKCCRNYTCDRVGLSAGTFCCREVRQTCNGDTGPCCRDQVCDRISGLSGFRCCGTVNASCQSSGECCGNFRCLEGRCLEV